VTQLLVRQYLQQAEMTLSDTVTFSGKGLFSGDECRLLLHPAEAGTGIEALFGNIAVPCTVGSILEEGSHTTTIGSHGVELRSVEHLLAALYFCGISNCIIEVAKGNEVPNDGSGACSEYVSEILRVGAVKQYSHTLGLSPASRRWFRWNGSTAVVEPKTPGDVSGTFQVQVFISFAPPVGRQAVGWRSGIGEMNDYFKFTEARSFLRRPLNYMWPEGVDHWTYLHDSIRGLPISKSELRLMAFEDNDWLIPPRYEYEAAWHKLVDLVGDLSLIGGRFCGKLKVWKPGHAFNHRLVHWLIGGYRSEMPITARLD
jgi:UDP-3-O-acyl-N-acetylglucosamine deacetylase